MPMAVVAPEARRSSCTPIIISSAVCRRKANLATSAPRARARCSFSSMDSRVGVFSKSCAEAMMGTPAARASASSSGASSRRAISQSSAAASGSSARAIETRSCVLMGRRPPSLSWRTVTSTGRQQRMAASSTQSVSVGRPSARNSTTSQGRVSAAQAACQAARSETEPTTSGRSKERRGCAFIRGVFYNKARAQTSAFVYSAPALSGFAIASGAGTW